jgi:hypothetical protein
MMSRGDKVSRPSKADLTTNLQPSNSFVGGIRMGPSPRNRTRRWTDDEIKRLRDAVEKFGERFVHSHSE